jgi:mannose-6-phosphate isomerase
MERVWGGRRLEEVFHKALPPDVPIGESWELVDREDAQSVAVDGTALHDLWTQSREQVFGTRAVNAGKRFPLLIKLLDAREALSVQVHPPASIAASLGGEPKSEMWFLAGADPGAHLLVGLKRGTTRETFTHALETGEDVSQMLQRIDVQRGDAIYLPSGRVHAIGPGCLIVEIQQNSDTTYRVFDYGRPRELHVEQSVASIDWDDVEPALLPREGETVAQTEYFTVSRWLLAEPRRATAPGECAIVCVLSGRVSCADQVFNDGDVFLVPANADDPQLWPARAAEVLVIELPVRAPSAPR